LVRSLQLISPAQCTWLLATNAVQGEAISNLNIPAVLEYRVKTTPSELKTGRSFMGNKTTTLLIDSPQEALDIDTGWDFYVAKIIAEGVNGI
jgi:hypothetical protein